MNPANPETKVEPNTLTVLLSLRMRQDGEVVRMDFASLSDATPKGWNPADPKQTETGPNWHGVLTLPGTLPEKISQEFVDAVGDAVRRALKGEAFKLVASSS